MSAEPFHYTNDGARSRFSKAEIVASLKEYGRLHRKSSFGREEYDNWSGRLLHSSNISKRFGSWGKALQAAGFRLISVGGKLDPQDMVTAFRDCWHEHGSVPNKRRLDEHLEKHSCPFRAKSVERFFGGLGRLAKLIGQVESGQLPESKLYERHKTARRLYSAVSLKLRKAVLKRDGYRCVKCGANPKDDKSVRLEVDHIKPGSRGGPATLENLQTLCFSCNQGKKDDDD
jgi:hypothetical protein